MRHELKKLFTWKMALLFILCVVVNGYFYYNQQILSHGELLQDYPYYIELLDTLQENPEMDFQQISDPDHNFSVYTVQQQQKYLQMYPDFIKGMPERAKAASKLSTSGSSLFSQYNIEKTVKDFSGMETLPIQADVDFAINALYSFTLSDIIVLAFLLFLCVKLFSTEYELHLYPLILATPSRLKVALHKMGTLFLLTLLITAAIYGINLSIGGMLFGFGDLSRPLQSISEFRTCSLPISCFDYLWIGFIIKFFSAFIFGLFTFLVFTLLKKAVVVFWAVVVFGAVSFWLYSTIDVTSNLNALHFINAIHMMDSFSIISRYQNINLFGYPFSVTTVLPFIFLILSVFCIVIILMQFHTSAVCRAAKQNHFISQMIDWVRKTADQTNHHTLIFFHELRKFFIKGRALFILLALSVFLFYTFSTSFRFEDSTTKEYNNYIDKIGGRITSQTQQFIADEWEFLLNLEDSSLYTGKIQALPLIENQVNNALQNEEELGIPAFLIDETGYLKLVADTNSDIYDTAVVLIASILCCAGIFASENTFGTKKLLRICRGGSQLIYHKLSISLIFCVLITVLVNLTRYAIVAKDYSLDHMDAPVQSISIFLGYKSELNILQYLLLLYTVRLFGGIVIGMVLSGISSFCQNNAIAISVSFGLLVAPVIAIGSGIHVLKYVSIFPFTGGNPVLRDSVFSQIWYGAFAVFCLIFSFVAVKRQWRKE